MKWIGSNFLKNETKRIFPIICRLEVRDLPNTFQDQKKNDQCSPKIRENEARSCEIS